MNTELKVMVPVKVKPKKEEREQPLKPLTELPPDYKHEPVPRRWINY